ncbi:hypothetical protein EDC04DRAFT_2579629, partial [Pisolithus marmoratus]
LIPLAYASIYSQLTYSWMTNLMILGYQHTLQASDLYKLDLSRQAGPLAEKPKAAWRRHVKVVADWNDKLDQGEIHPSILKLSIWAICCRAVLEQNWRVVGRRKHPSLTWALHNVFGRTFWVSSVFRVVGDVAQIMGLLVLKAIISFSEQRLAVHLAGELLPNVSHGIGMALGLWILMIVTSLCANQYYWYSMETGIVMHAVLIACIFEHGVMLTGKERVKLVNATLVNHISTDVSDHHI